MSTPAPKKNPHAQKLGVLGGSKNSPAQVAARAENAKLAGRPRRICTTCGEIVFGGHKNRALDRRCDGHTWAWQTPTEKRAAAADKAARKKAG